METTDINKEMGGLGSLLSAEVLKKLNELLERLHQADNRALGSINVNIYKPGSQHVETIQSQNIYTYKQQSASEESISITPPPEAMATAVEQTIAQGYWWASTAWSVVYRVYQMKRYKGGIRQFVREVQEWPFTMHIRYDCNDDAVGKPIRTGKISRSLDMWSEDGASSQFIILGKALMKSLARFQK